MTKNGTTIRMSLAALVCGLVATSTAWAANKNLAIERQAKKACLSGDYAKGVGLLADLYVESNDPVYLYNQGRCYEQNVRYVEAAERFKEYLRKATKLSADDKADVDKHIADCEASAAKTQSRALATEPAPAPSPPVLAPPLLSPEAPVPAPPSPALTAAPQAPTEVTYGWPHTAKWIAASVAVAGLGFGVVENLRYYSKNRDYNNDPSCPSGAGCKSLADSADLAQTLEFVGYGTAVVATGAAITFWLIDSPRTSSQSSARVSCLPTIAGVSCGGRF